MRIDLAFMNEFVTRAEFVALYPTTDTPDAVRRQVVSACERDAARSRSGSTQLSILAGRPRLRIRAPARKRCCW